MSTPEPRLLPTLLLLLALVLAGGLASADAPRLGQPLTAAELAALPRSVFPDGRGLPAGAGTATQGAVIYQAQCAACHGDGGRGGSGGHLIGEGPLAGPDPDPAVNTYWPYATTLWDFIHRAMPMQAPGSLSADDTYAVTGYLLHRAGLLDAEVRLDAERLAALRMPNRDGFDWIDVPRPAASTAR